MRACDVSFKKLTLLRRTAVPKLPASGAHLYPPDMDGIKKVKCAHMPILHDVIESVFCLARVQNRGERLKLVLHELVRVLLCLAVEVLERKTREVVQPVQTLLF